jgi:hypothetical protein
VRRHSSRQGSCAAAIWNELTLESLSAVWLIRGERWCKPPSCFLEHRALTTDEKSEYASGNQSAPNIKLRAAPVYRVRGRILDARGDPLPKSIGDYGPKRPVAARPFQAAENALIVT